ncbi:M15 family metallopeptidase [Cytophagaceae bacterium DM2B3-1]|uniref:M15 family metallopeptidase n=2 Tax=Xanthocytophaga TaxID=3078918 RepID=A0AAE3U558_9BACT|nr:MULTISPECIES: M15 family metallopeptidase [Xanthocytophaga]MDJ1466536.1 M15 family metallopeptidase [Xanthocytophaga flavus]MDJ1479192.1 M15 family metallopeptidase [Xanthocytophaga flavus]MDJ1492533.1 M15 family metallopeptidase [Xanthocytophaga flavus]MDJ1500755.1 M15 family metallopeptidase [Xanthocytophaga agilis]
MAASLDVLTPEFKEKAQALLENCKLRGVVMRPNETLRSPFVQARYWRQSRTIEEIRKKINELKQKNALFLAHCLEVVGPQHGDHVTNAIPGLSWHQWGEAMDCFWVVNNEAVWSATEVVNGINGYMIYAGEAKKLGLDAGYFWKSFPDIPHVQLRKASNPAKVFDLLAINDAMEQTFGNTQP